MMLTNRTALSWDILMSNIHKLDTTGLICPEPIMLLHKTMRKATTGDKIEILATDPATTRDIPNFCRHLGHELLEQGTLDDGHYHYVIVKG